MSRIDDLGNLPTWQLALAFVGGAALIGAGWYFVYYKVEHGVLSVLAFWHVSRGQQPAV